MTTNLIDQMIETELEAQFANRVKLDEMLAKSFGRETGKSNELRQRIKSNAERVANYYRLKEEANQPPPKMPSG